MKSFAHELGDDGLGLFAHWQPYALGIVIATGFLMLQSAFQAGDLRAALPTLEVAEPVVAGILGLTLMHERLHATDLRDQVVILLAVALMVVSAVVLARSAAGDRGEAVAGNETAEVDQEPLSEPNRSSSRAASRRRSTLPDSSQGSSDWSPKTATWRGTR
jgi:hypothetical protein